MITDKRIVKHIFQNKVEYWKHCSIKGWIPSTESEANDWAAGSFEYVELRHNMEPNKHGMFGPLIKI